MHLIVASSCLAGGVAIANAIPHLASGTTGRRFPSPFATPPGRGLSSPTVNVLWGILNLAVGYVLVCRVGAFDPHDTGEVLAFAAGASPTALFCARHFGHCHDGSTPERP